MSAFPTKSWSAFNLDRSPTGKPSRRLRLSILEVGQTHLARKRSEEITCVRSLRPAGLGWINFAVLRRSHSTLHKHRKSDLKIIADQQGHGMRTHLEEYVQSGVAERKAEAVEALRRFYGVFRKRG